MPKEEDFYGKGDALQRKMGGLVNMFWNNMGALCTTEPNLFEICDNKHILEILTRIHMDHEKGIAGPSPRGGKALGLGCDSADADPVAMVFVKINRMG
ncbi:hypothetical protein ACJX0J_028114, partial [Zea mays]